MGGVCPGTMDAGAIRPHRVLPCGIDRPVRPGHHHHHRCCRRRGHRAPGTSRRRRNLRRWWLPHRPQCRASQCPLQRNPLPAYFDQRLQPALGSLLELASADIEPGDLLHAVSSLCLPADDDRPGHAQRMVDLLVDGLRYRARATVLPRTGSSTARAARGTSPARTGARRPPHRPRSPSWRRARDSASPGLPRPADLTPADFPYR
jgi:hypothetical protein